MQGIIRNVYFTIVIIRVSKLMYFKCTWTWWNHQKWKTNSFCEIEKRHPAWISKEVAWKIWKCSLAFMTIVWSRKFINFLHRFSVLLLISKETVDRISTESYLSFTYICILRIWHVGIHIYGTWFAWLSDISLNWSGSCQFLFVVSNK